MKPIITFLFFCFLASSLSATQESKVCEKAVTFFDSSRHRDIPKMGSGFDS